MYHLMLGNATFWGGWYRGVSRGTVRDDNEFNFVHAAFEKPMNYTTGSVQEAARSMAQRKMSKHENILLT